MASVKRYNEFMKDIPAILKQLRHDPSLIELANEHHLNGLLFFHYKDLFPEPTFRTEWKRQWYYNQTLKNEVAILGKSFLAAGLTSPTLLKGVALFESLYPDLGSRFVSDCDLLVDTHELDSVVKILKDQGYSLLSQKSWRANHFKKEFSKMVDAQEINIELHTQLFYHAQIPLQFVSSSMEGFRQLDKVDMVLHLAGHLAFQHTFLKLYWLFDLYFYLKKYGDELNWDYLIIRSRKLKIEQSLLSVLNVLEKEFDLIFPVMKKKNWSVLKSSFLLRPQQSKMHYFLLKHRLKDHWLEAFRYDYGWIVFQIKQKISATKRK